MLGVQSHRPEQADFTEDRRRVSKQRGRQGTTGFPAAGRPSSRFIRGLETALLAPHPPPSPEQRAAPKLSSEFLSSVCVDRWLSPSEAWPSEAWPLTPPVRGITLPGT